MLGSPSSWFQIPSLPPLSQENRCELNHLHIQDLPWTPKGIWPTGDIWADGKPLGHHTGTAWAGWSRSQIKQLEEFGSPGCRSCTKSRFGTIAEALSFALWLPLSSSALVLCNFDVKPRAEVSEKQLCKGSSLVRCRCLILYKWGLTQVHHCQGVHHEHFQGHVQYSSLWKSPLKTPVHGLNLVFRLFKPQVQ